jgi:hypothetical protein
MPTNIIGIRNNNTIVPYSAATKRTKQVNLSLAAGAGFTLDSTSRAVAIFYADSSGNWRMRFNIEVTGDCASGQNWKLAINNVTFKNTGGVGQAISLSVYDSTFDTALCLAEDNTSNLWWYVVGLSATSLSNTKMLFSGDVELNAEPTTYTTAANMEGVTAVDVYIAPASPIISGLVSTEAQTFAGVKTFNDGVKLDDAAGQSILNFYATTLVSAASGTYTGGTVYCTRFGNLITLRFTELTHASSGDVLSGAGLIPADYRPSALITNIYYMDGNTIRQVWIGSDGKVNTTYRDWAGNISPQGSSGPQQFSISYTI